MFLLNFIVSLCSTSVYSKVLSVLDHPTLDLLKLFGHTTRVIWIFEIFKTKCTAQSTFNKFVSESDILKAEVIK
jgi:hypothetical protein